MAQNGRRMERRINLAALRKQDPNVDCILDTASSVAHYKFDATTEKWEKTEFEGSMFLYNRHGPETEVAFLVMNRLNKDNLIINVKPGMEFKLQEPFLLCRTVSEIIGIWFYDIQECTRISALLSSIAAVSRNQPDLSDLINKLIAGIEKREAPKIDLMQMFMHAKEEYDKKETQGENLKKSASMTRFTNDQKVPTVLKRNNSFSEGIDEDLTDRSGLTMTSSQSSNESNPLMRLLQANKLSEKKPRSRTLSYGEQTSTARSDIASVNGDNIQRKSGGLFLPVSNQRNDQPFSSDFEKSKAIDVAMLEATVLWNSPSKNNSTRPGDMHSRTEVSKAVSKKADSKDRSALLTDVLAQTNEGDSAKSVTNLMTPASIASSRSSAQKTPVAGIGRGRGLASILNITEKRPDDRNQIQQLTTTSSQAHQGETQSKSLTPRKESGLAMKFPDPPSSGLVNSLMSPMQFRAVQKSNAPQPNVTNPSETTQLSKQQFQEAIIHLLQNDDMFVERLHSSYLNMTDCSKR